MANARSGPLSGIKVLEMGGIGPLPHAGMLLADLGATVVRVDRTGGRATTVDGKQTNVSSRGKNLIQLDLKDPEAIEAVLQMAESFDIFLEGNRPGVTERLGIGPDDVLARNPKIVYGRMTGWGQYGLLSPTAGHDMNYISVAGALRGSGQHPDGIPQFPYNLVGDFAGGSMYLVVGVLAALNEAHMTGKGQVIDAAIVDGTAHLMAMNYDFRNMIGPHTDYPLNGTLDGKAPFYSVYATSDGKYVSVGSIEPQFFAILIERTGIDYDPKDEQNVEKWPELRAKLAAAFVTKTRDEWTDVFTGTDGCVQPILTIGEAAQHQHNVDRQTIQPTADGTGLQPGLAPRFSHHPDTTPSPIATAGSATRSVLSEFTRVDIDGLITRGAAVQTEEVTA
jgi:alpha-methylacyl-CoA racemase